MRSLHLIAQIYRPKTAEHLQRMIDCIEHNAGLPFVKGITLLDENSGVQWTNTKIRALPLIKRASYGDLIDAARVSGALECSHFALMNSDIFLTTDVHTLLNRLNKPSTVAAVTRRELDGQLRPQPQCSQDIWVFKSHQPSVDLVYSCCFRLGVAGCENLFAMSLYAHGYEVWNPCANCVITHNDPSPRMNFPEWVFGAYLWLPPCAMEDIEIKAPSYLVKVVRKNFTHASS